MVTEKSPFEKKNVLCSQWQRKPTLLNLIAVQCGWKRFIWWKLLDLVCPEDRRELVGSMVWKREK